ncbi:hypothetical protein Cni_G04195 [Canna indica]|uniref:Uncharacterized protein n=1 Tax=Canna indica TaxID=4628 RepID=A0AAQ3JUA0_9LILI|nr:hypothetical protein Cni_G04195 [Canna indica]
MLREKQVKRHGLGHTHEGALPPIMMNLAHEFSQRPAFTSSVDLHSLENEAYRSMMRPKSSKRARLEKSSRRARLGDLGLKSTPLFGTRHTGQPYFTQASNITMEAQMHIMQQQHRREMEEMDRRHRQQVRKMERRYQEFVAQMQGQFNYLHQAMLHGIQNLADSIRLSWSQCSSLLQTQNFAPTRDIAAGGGRDTEGSTEEDDDE